MLTRCLLCLMLLATAATPAWAQDAAAAAPASGWLASLTGLMGQGGLMLIPLAICSFLLCLFTFERAISLRRARVIPRPFVRRLIHQLAEGEIDEYEALERCRENRSPIADVFATAVVKAGRTSVEVNKR